MILYLITRMITDILLQRTSGLMQWRPLRVEFSLIQSSHHPSGQPSLQCGMARSYSAYSLPAGARRCQIFGQVFRSAHALPEGRGPGSHSTIFIPDAHTQQQYITNKSSRATTACCDGS